MATLRKRSEHQHPSLQDQGTIVPSAVLRKWDEIPAWQRDNEYILSGYREPTASFARCFQSLARLHNETVNIYTHLIGAAFFSLTPIYLLRLVYGYHPLATRQDIFVFSTFFYGVAICFLLSST